MKRTWEEFDEGPPFGRRDGNYTTLNYRGEIIINRHTFEEMDSPEAVVLLYDRHTDAIGIKPSSLLMPNAFPVKPKGTCGHRLIRVKPFIARHDMRIDGTVRFRTAAVENGILILDLRQMTKATRTPRPGRDRR